MLQTQSAEYQQLWRDVTTAAKAELGRATVAVGAVAVPTALTAVQASLVLDGTVSDVHRLIMWLLFVSLPQQATAKIAEVESSYVTRSSSLVPYR